MASTFDPLAELLLSPLTRLVIMQPNRSSSPLAPSTAVTSRTDLRRRLFRIAMKDKNLRRLVEPFWRGVPTEIDGLRFALHPIDNTTERKLYQERKLVEAASLSALAEQLDGHNARVLDIGANCGLYTLYLARYLAAGSRLLAFEPNPTMADRLERNLALNAPPDGVGVEVHRVALANEEGTAELHLHDRNLGQSSLHSIDRSQHAITVPRHTLSRYMASRGHHDCCAIKIDVEGHEDTVLYDFIEQCEDGGLPDVVLIEVERKQAWKRDLLGLFKARSYTEQFAGDGNALLVRR